MKISFSLHLLLLICACGKVWGIIIVMKILGREKKECVKIIIFAR